MSGLINDVNASAVGNSNLISTHQFISFATFSVQFSFSLHAMEIMILIQGFIFSLLSTDEVGFLRLYGALGLVSQARDSLRWKPGVSQPYSNSKGDEFFDDDIISMIEVGLGSCGSYNFHLIL